MRIRNICQGISVLEVMIAFAATTVFVAVSAPLSRDLGVRLRVIEGMDVVAVAQDALVRRCEDDPAAKVTANRDAGFDFVPSAQGYIDRIELSADCATSHLKIVLGTRNTGASVQPVIELTSAADESERWSCRLLSGEPQHVPKICWPSK